MTSPTLARVTKTPRGYFHRKGYALVGNKASNKGYAALLVSRKLTPKEIGLGNIPESFIQNELNENDLVLISPNGGVSVVWEANSNQNGLLLTEACDCHCLMCPQPPKKNDPGLLDLAHQILDCLEPNEFTDLCLTGGEPSLLKDDFVALLEKINRKFSKKQVTLLTNGKSFSDFTFAKRCAIAAGGQIQFCISLHADNDHDHDKIVGVQGSFQKTIKGITNLAKLRVPIEIRFVISKINVDRMTEFADFCYRNFPFTVHVAFMAMEIRGLAEENIQDIWIDPMMYGEKVRFAANRHAMRNMRVSIYNMPLCLIPREGWPLARQSISNWKNDFMDVCHGCDVQSQCAGVFTSSSKQSEFLEPVKLKVDSSN
jgi:His-Xaa-Ser system radical SAM maturase HxsC